MELIIIFVTVVTALIANFMMKINEKELEKIALDEELNKISKKYPSNIDICKYVLNKLENKTTKVEEDINSEATLYFVIKDTISIGNTHESFTRIQIMVHECLHSIQDKKMLIFNYIYSNIYFFYFFIICILALLGKISNKLIYSNILVILGFLYYVVRIYLENDAMIKSEYVTKEFIQEKNISSKEEISKIYQGLRKINDATVKGTNCKLFTKIMINVAIFNLIIGLK